MAIREPLRQITYRGAIARTPARLTPDPRAGRVAVASRGKMDRGRLGMRVELPRLLSVFAHELRGPLSVIQGYLRLMLKQRDDSHAETPMIRAMLEATGRLATLGRQASDISLWCGPAPLDREVTVAELTQKAAALAAPGAVSATLDNRTGLDAVTTSDPEALAAALAALAESTARDSSRPVRLSGRSDAEEATCTILVSPEAAIGVAGDRPAASSASAVAFDRGGFGLSLVMASYVLDAHGADVRAAADGGGTVEVRLQKAGGSR
jgi:signal transduction histidine kinase